ncbi:MAG: hypothetical protein L0Y54_10090 [Sporichthyaceae bacterium]|nr:hypothetical protein [Sporichthyaceae bacterium]
MPVITGTNKLTAAGLSLGQPKPAVGLYDFATDGGAVSTITLRGDQVPSGAIITDALLHVETALTGGTATDTLQLGSEGAADIQAAAARNAAPWSTTGAKRVTLTATAAPVKTTAARSLTFGINATALTAGKFTLAVWYVELG